MDICDDILDQNDRYAFLLGSALRNQEQDKFLEIYDKAIPKDLNEKELEEIKDRARRLATVSEEEFAQIACRARDYSLAQPSLYAQPYDPAMLDNETTEEISKIECMRGTASVSSVSSLSSDFPSDIYSHMDKPGLSSLQRTSRHFGPRSETEFSVSDASDSGIYLNNSKLDSVSDHDEYERPGCFDYVQSCQARSMQPQIDIVTVKNLTEYNERFSPHPASMTTTTTHKVNLRHGQGTAGQITVHNPRLFESNSDNDNGTSPGSPRSEDSGSAFEEGGLHQHHPARAKFDREIEMVSLRKRGSVSPDPEAVALLHPEVKKCQRHETRKHNNQVYDEAFPIEVRSVSSGSQDSSSASSGEELQQVIVKNPDSDVDISYVNVHSRLYDGRHTHYSSSTREFTEDYLECDDDLEEDDDPGRALQRLSDSISKSSPGFKSSSANNSYEREVNFRSAQHYGAARSYGSFGRERDVDRGVNFGLGSNSSALSSGGVRVEKSVLSKATKSQQPPFGDPLQFDRIGTSSSRLLQGSSMRSQETKNMPDAEIIKPSEGKRKKKRKKKEESEEKSDINGNPLEEGRARSLTKQVEPYNKSSESSHYYTDSRFPSSPQHFDKYNVLNSEMMPGVTDQKLQEKKERRKKKKQQEDKGLITAAQIAGNRGDEDVDALLNFIEGEKGSNHHHNNTNNRKPQKNRLPLSPQQQQTLPRPANNVGLTAVSTSLVKDDYTRNRSLSPGTQTNGTTSHGGEISGSRVANFVIKESREESPPSCVATVATATTHTVLLQGSTEDFENKKSAVSTDGGPVVKKEVKKKKKNGSTSSASVSKENSMDCKDSASDASSVSGYKEVVGMATDDSVAAVVENGVAFPPGEVNYIFTDFETHKAVVQEPEFQTVVSSRKKKKQHQSKDPADNVRAMSNGGGGSFINGFSNSNNAFSNAENNTKREYVNHLRQPRPNYHPNAATTSGNNKYTAAAAYKRSYTPPPTPTSVVVEEDKPHSRAFSPSAFPALAKKAGGGAAAGGSVATGRGQRRNSTGNAIELEIEKEDSDLESCKSVPAATKPRAGDSSHVADGNVLDGNSLPAGIHPVPKVSYAKVLGIHQRQQESLAIDGGHNHESPERERRHSLGNLPHIPPPGQLDSALKQGVARSQELANVERSNGTPVGNEGSSGVVLSSGVSSLSSGSKASSLANSKYSSTENLASTARETSPQSEDIAVTTATAVTINPSSETDFPPIIGMAMTGGLSFSSSSSSNFESNVHVHTRNNNISSSSAQLIDSLSQANNKWNTPPPLVNTTHHSHTRCSTAKPAQSEVETQKAELASSSSTSSLCSSKHIQPQGQPSTVTPASAANAAASIENSSSSNVSSLASSDKVVLSVKNNPVGGPSDSSTRKPAVLQSGNNVPATSSTSKNIIKVKSNTAPQSVGSNLVKAQTNGKKQPAALSSNVNKTVKMPTTQSVIFLDRKFNEETNNFGISFGFEPELENAHISAAVDEDSRPSEAVVSDNKSSVITATTTDGVLTATTTDGICIAAGGPSTDVLSTGVVPSAAKDNNHVIVTNSVQEVSFISKQPLLSGANPLASNPPPNGIVLPISLTAVPSGIRPLLTDQQGMSIKKIEKIVHQTSGSQQTSISASVTAGEKSRELVSPVAFQPDIADSSSHVTSGESVAAETIKTGEEGVKVSSTATTAAVAATSYVFPKLPSRDQDPNYQRGKFDQERIVSYIYNEWCNVMQEGDKVRDSVSVYGRDLS